MDLQRTGVLPAQPNAAQVQALHALENIQGAVQGADGRVQQAYEETIRRLQEALNQSEANNRLLSEQNVRQNQRIVQLNNNLWSERLLVKSHIKLLKNVLSYKLK